MFNVDPKSFSRKRALITGGLGFIGSNLAGRLIELGVQVTLVDRLAPRQGGNLFNVEAIGDQVQIESGDVADELLVARLIEDKDFIFNLAGQTSHLDSMRDPYSDLADNCRAPLGVLEACRKVNPAARIVFASTRQVYGRPSYLPADEDHPIEPIDVNGIHKMAGEWYHSLYGRVYGLATCSLRLTNTYGPRMRVKDARQTFLGDWIRRVIEGEELEVYGDGSQLRDFNYVDDAVEALLLAAASPDAAGQVFNLGAPDPVSLRELAELLIELNGEGRFKLVPFPPERLPIDIGDYYADYRRVNKTLGWEPETGLREGLARTLEFFRRHGEHYWSRSDR